ncbi:MAG: CocE/NonD family hydrolase [Vicinamibacterales bacterium]
MAAPRSAGDDGRFRCCSVLPYRKDDGRGRDYDLFAYFVRRGYVVARVDIRGTGRSEGDAHPVRSASEIEQQDGEQVIGRLSTRPFSNGQVGMFGISWAASMPSMAMRNPPALKAILAVDATDDLYQDDVHFMDGMMHLDSWEWQMDIANSMPGAPTTVSTTGSSRSASTSRRGCSPTSSSSRGRSHSGIGRRSRPATTRSGSHLRHRRLVRRLPRQRAAHARHLSAPVKAIVGPWNHTIPHRPYPKPGIEWRREAVRWFDLAQGPRHRHHGRAAAGRLRATMAPAQPVSRRGARRVALRGRLADRPYP